MQMDLLIIGLLMSSGKSPFRCTSTDLYVYVYSDNNSCGLNLVASGEKKETFIFPIFLFHLSLSFIIFLCVLFFRNMLILTWTYFLSHDIKYFQNKIEY
jgi:hypothetical protein